MVSINDVANAAGVAPSTVSYVISGRRSISPKTRRLVEETIRKLGYRPHAGGARLAISRTGVLAMVLPLRTDQNVDVMMEFVASAVQTARAHGHDLLLLTQDDGPAALQRVALSGLADALIVTDVETDDRRVPMLIGLDRPAVLIGLPAAPSGLTCVDLDFAAAGAACVTHLAELGHRSIAHIGSSPEVYQRGTGYAARFRRGFSTTAADLRVRAISRPCAPSAGAVRECLDAVFSHDRELTGLVVHNEAVLAAVLSELDRRGRRIPDDVSVVAVCPDSMATNHRVSLTTVSIPARELGALAVELTVRQLTRHELGRTRLLKPRLTVRDSTAPRHPGGVGSTAPASSDDHSVRLDPRGSRNAPA